MHAFTDPRTDPDPGTAKPAARTTSELESLAELHSLCREGRLYDVERWIRTDRPLQLAEETPVGRRRVTSALEIALEEQNQALALLLLCNGYDPNLEPGSPLDLALRARRWDLVDLLLDWGADPNLVDLGDLFGTYKTDLFERFRALGVDLTAGHRLAETLAFHTSNKPLFGFAKRHCEHDPRIQTELDIALAHHAGKGNEKGVNLCLWAGADPHAPVPSLGDVVRYDEEDGDTDKGEEGFVGFSAIHKACLYGRIRVLERLGPDPARDDFDALYRAADNDAVVELLARLALPKDVGSLIHHYIWWLTAPLAWNRWESSWGSLYTLRRLFELGVRWEESSKDGVGVIRRMLLKTPDGTFVDLMKLLATKDYCSPEILHELARTPAIRRRMKEVGFIPPEPGDAADSRPSRRSRPTRSREVLKKFGVDVKKPPPRPLPRTEEIGTGRPDAREVRLDRAALFERVWSEPVTTLAEKWGMSGRGLAKACRRLKVPVPPRGYWAKVRAGQRVRRPRLPELEPGQAETIVIWASD